MSQGSPGIRLLSLIPAGNWSTDAAIPAARIRMRVELSDRRSCALDGSSASPESGILVETHAYTQVPERTRMGSNLRRGAAGMQAPERPSEARRSGSEERFWEISE